ncbi:hypothetical protein FO519_004692 [Halicephalobus sp. NKZ332]|nr:hypothetical protein FO519_004692 [Halicephalobus sp. NKZ332]
MRINLSVERQTGLGRICRITEWGTFPEPTDIQTPAYLTYTRVGHIPNITWDVYEKELKQNLKQRQVFQLTLGSFYDSLDAVEGIGIRDFCFMPKDSILHLTHHDSLKKIPANSNTTKSMALWAKAGRRSIDAKIYTKVLKMCQVHSFVGLNDFDTPLAAQRKRLGKSLFRTTEWNNEMMGIKSLDGHLDGLMMKKEHDIDETPFIPLGGGFSKEYRTLAVNNMNNLPYATAFAIDLWHVSQGNVDGKESFDQEVVKDLIGDVSMALPPEAPKLVEGAFDPSQILSLVKLGIDLFDSSYAILLADKGQSFRIGENYWKTGEFKVLDFKNDEFKEDMDLLYPDCGCHTCKTFKKAYIKHLIDTKELLGPVLLTIHNMTEFDRMKWTMLNWIGDMTGRVDNETKEEADYRNAREELTEWNSTFWTAHNQLFEKKKSEFIKMKKQKLGKLEQVSPADMSVFYREFLNERAEEFRKYNNEWYRRNFSLIFPAMKINWIRFCRLLKR